MEVALFETGVELAKSVEIFIERKFPCSPAIIYVERDDP
jgi:hypothetical protein